MGWWSTDVMGGDPALDALDGLERVLGVGNLHPETAQSWQENVDNALALQSLKDERQAIEKWLTSESYDAEIRLQVLGVVMMAAGAEIDDDLRSRIIAAAKNDSWSRHSPQRAESMRKFTAAIEAYDGTPAFMNSVGLFEAIGNFQAAGKLGLVNKR